MGGYFEKEGYTEERRRWLFWNVCVVVRVLLAYAAYRYREHPRAEFWLTMGAAVAVYSNWSHLDDQTVWWSRRTHLLTSLALLLALKMCPDKRAPAAILSLDVAFGVHRAWCKN